MRLSELMRIDPERLQELAAEVRKADLLWSGCAEEEHARSEMYDQARQAMWEAESKRNGAWNALRDYLKTPECSE